MNRLHDARAGGSNPDTRVFLVVEQGLPECDPIASLDDQLVFDRVIGAEDADTLRRWSVVNIADGLALERDIKASSDFESAAIHVVSLSEEIPSTKRNEHRIGAAADG